MARGNYSSGSGQQQSTSSGSSQSFTPTQGKWMDKLVRKFGKRTKQGDPMATYQGDRVAGFGDLQSGALNQAQGFLDSFRPGQGMPLFGETGNTLAGILRGEGGAPQLSMDQANETFNKQYVNPAYRQFTQDTSPLIQEQFSGPGFWSSARAGAVGDAAGDLQSELNAGRAGYLWDTEQTNRALQEAQAGRTQAGVSQAMQYGMMPTQQELANLQGTQALFNFGQAEQQQRQRETNADIEQFMSENRMASPEDMQILLSLLGMQYTTQQQESQSTGSDKTKSIGGGILWA